MTSSAEVCQYLLSLEGKPYTHQGRYHTSGTVDCLGLVLAACHRFGLTDFDCTDYGLQAFGYKLLEFCDRECQKISGLEIGCLLVFKIKRLPQHLGIFLGEGKMIHAAGASGVRWCKDKRVQVVTLDQKWRDRIVGVYRLPGVR